MSNTKLKAIELKQGKTSLYVFSAKARKLFNLLDINRRDPDKDEGYQRVLSDSRVKAITKFVDEGKVLAPSILVSFDKGKFNKQTKELEIPTSKTAGWVIDGQHRLAGAAKAREDIDLAVVAFLGLDEDEQINQFVTINREGKGVPTSLYLDLLKRLPTNHSPASVANLRSVDIANLLNKNEESALHNRIVTIGSPSTGRSISLNNFARKVAVHVHPEKGFLNSYSITMQAKVIDNLFKGLKVVEPGLFTLRPSILFKTIGFGGLLNSFPLIFTTSLGNYQGFTVENVANIFKKANFDFRNWEGLGTGSAAERLAGEDLNENIRLAFSDDDGNKDIQLKLE